MGDAMETTTAGRRTAAHWRGQPIAAVLFDLDGTLLDTAADIALALNRAVTEFGWAPVSDRAVRAMIGRGAPMLIRRLARAQDRTLDDAAHAALTERFFEHYGALQDSGQGSAQPFDGARDALRALHTAGLCLGVVTNKQRRFALSLMRRLGLERWLDCIVGGDSCERRKPDPEPLLFACQSLQVPAAQALMVGDSTNDVQAARAAGIPVVCVPYGYNEGEDPRTLPCDAMIESLALLPAMLLGREA
jgi:phosphoglycolate phosphatase